MSSTLGRSRHSTHVSGSLYFRLLTLCYALYCRGKNIHSAAVRFAKWDRTLRAAESDVGFAWTTDDVNLDDEDAIFVSDVEKIIEASDMTSLRVTAFVDEILRTKLYALN